MKYKPFTYEAEGYVYRLVLVFYLNSTKHIRVMGAELYGTRNSKYYGFWSRENIPMNLVYQMENRARWLYVHGQYTEDEKGKFREVVK